MGHQGAPKGCRESGGDSVLGVLGVEGATSDMTVQC